MGVTFKTEEERDLAILNLVNIAGTHVMFENQEIVAYNALVNPALKEKGSKNDNMTWTAFINFINLFRNLLCFISAKHWSGVNDSREK